MAAVPLFIDEIRSNPNARISIGFTDEEVLNSFALGPSTNRNGRASSPFVEVNGFVMDDFSSGGGNEFNTLFDLAGASSLESLFAKASVIQTALEDRLEGTTAGKALDKAVKFKFPSIRLKTVQQTQKRWVSSTIPQFSVTLLFIAITQDDLFLDNVRDNVRQLLRTVTPSVSEDVEIIKPPLDYEINSTKGKVNRGRFKVGTSLITIGSWFAAPFQLIRNFTYTLSREVTSTGNPLYAKCTLTFEPYQQVGLEELQSYITGVQTAQDKPGSLIDKVLDIGSRVL